MSETDTEANKSPWVSHYFVIIPDGSRARILMLPSPQGWRLPDVRLEGVWLSESARIIAGVREKLALDFDFTILRYIAIEVNEEERWDRLLLVLEPRQAPAAPPLAGQWVDRLALYHIQLAQPEQAAPLIQFLEENEEGGAQPLDPRRSPWARPGWFAAAAAWMEEAIADAGYRQKGPVEQLRNWSLSSLLVAPTSAGRFYFKAAAALPLFVNEPALTQTLAGLFPGQVPTPLKIDRVKRWMVMKEFRPSVRDKGKIDFAKITRAFGKLQVASAEHLPELEQAGCIDRRLAVLAAQIDPLLADPLTQAALGDQDYAALAAFAPQLKERCQQLAEYHLPATLLHGDLHGGNITRQGRGYLFFDWTDASIGFPFLDHFMLYFYEKGAEAKRARDGYLAKWRAFESPQRLLEAWEMAKPLCALHHSVSYLTIINHLEPLVREELFHGLPDNLRHLLAALRA